MSKIQELLNSDDTILVFDIDGVLARMEFGEYNHYYSSDEDWSKKIEEGYNFYPDSLAISSLINFIDKKNKDNIYVCSKSYSDKEDAMKVDFVTRNYHIKEDHIFFVKNNDAKLDILNEIKEKHPNIPDNHIAMIDDTSDVLTNIMLNSDFATVHISSFVV